MFIAKLKGLELLYRHKILYKISQGINPVITPELKPESLPISEIYSYIDENQKAIQESRYNLRSVNPKSQFLDGVINISQKWYEYFFADDCNLAHPEEESRSKSILILL